MKFVGRRFGRVAIALSLAMGGSLAVAAVPAGAASGITASISNGLLTVSDQTSGGNVLIVDLSLEGPHAGKYAVGNFGQTPVTAGQGCVPGASPNLVHCDIPNAVLIDAGAGHDSVYAGPNFAHVGMIVVGGPGDDFISGTANADWLIGGDGNDEIRGNGSNDSMQGDAGNDGMAGGAGHDTMRGGAGNDRIYGDGGNDTLYGGAGNDLLNGLHGADNMFGEGGADTVSYADRGSKVTVTPDNIANDGAPNQDAPGSSGAAGDNVHDDIETIEGGSGNDTLYARANVGTALLGGAGHDALYGGSGADTMLGQDGVDTMLGGAGNDILIGGLGDDYSSGGPGDDIIVDGLFPYSPEGGTDTIVGDEGKDILMAFSGLDLVYAHDPVGSPGYGTETVDCGTGSDYFIADPGDTLVSCP